MPSRILVIDDEVDELEAWETTLGKAGYFVRTASKAPEALQLCDEFVFDLVILDYIMPKMKGLELLSRIRKKNPLIRSLLISGKLDETVAEQEVRESVRGEIETDKYLHKPVKNDLLLQTVEEVLQKDTSGKSWDAIATEYVEGEKGTVAKAKEAQGKLKKYIKKG